MKTNWKLTIHGGNVVAIRESDLPRKQWTSCENKEPCDEVPGICLCAEETKKYNERVKQALSTKGVKVTNVIGTFGCADGNPAILYGIGKNVEGRFFTIRMSEGQLYDIPEGWEVEFQNRVDVGRVYTDPERSNNASGAYQVATIVRSAPVEAPSIEKQEDQEATWDDVLTILLGEGNAPMFKTEKATLKSKYTLTRKP